MSSVAQRADPALLAGRLRLVVTRLNRRLRAQAGDALGPSAQSALATVARHGPLPLGELAAHEGVKPPSVTAIVAALQEHGLVTREADASDRRVTRIALSPRGRLWLQRSRGRKVAYLAARLSRLDEDRLRRLADAVGIA